MRIEKKMVMRKIHKIFFPTDFSDTAINAFRYAIWFASKYNAALDVWHFVAPQIEPIDFPILSGNVTGQKLNAAKEVMESFVKTGLRLAQEQHELQELPLIDTHVEIGASAKYISDKVVSRNIDLIIMGTQGEHNTLERMFGSVSSATIRKAPCPVLVIPPNTKKDAITSAAYATELDDADPIHIWEFRKLLAPFNPGIKILNIVDDLSGSEELSMDDLERYFREKEESANISFHRMIGTNKLELFTEFIEEHNVDLLVMYKPQRGFFDRLFHPSLTKKVALHLNVPMLVIK